ncbi:MAG TPA: helix-hairpin-helix domain-containing protein [Gemmatimonadaceae bacterium]|nr:helix-hairpin-helix domain-containing protein [Gemmatimonadaceae bacterium]
MPTPSEKKALLFLAAVAVLGVSVRALRAVGATPQPAGITSAALDRQLAAVDSARQAASAKVKGRGRAKSRSRKMRDSSSDSDGALLRATALRAAAVAGASFRRSLPLDLDVATAAQIESLPGVGPVLARRIVADRAARGDFGSLANFQRVKGIGPALAARLDSMVTFSGTPRPSSAAPPDSSVLPRRKRERRQRGRPP